MRLYLMPGFRLEFEGGDHRAGIDLHHVAEHVELFELGLDLHGDVLELERIVRALGRRLVQQIGGRNVVFGMFL